MYKKTYLPGITALRFFAASIVVLDHANYNSEKFGLPYFDWIAFNRGFEAVTFFFVLSGFLITYLLLSEFEQTATINIRNFYIKRVKRIWPLYFLIVFVGLALYNIVFPYVGIEYEVGYKVGEIIWLYVFFLANMAYSFFTTGGVLAVTWSIGIEEQFYLVWAPLVKRFIKKLISVLWAVYLFWFLVQVVNDLKIIELPNGWGKFIGTMQFNCMALGAIGAYYTYHYKSKVVSLPIFRIKGLQYGIFLTLITIFLIWDTQMPRAIFMQLLPILFLWLIVDTAINPSSLFKLENKFLVHLGAVSYGVYMYHYLMVYAFTTVWVKINKAFLGVEVLGVMLYYLLIFTFTVIIASLSFKYFESYFLKKNQFLPKRKVLNN